MPARRRDNNALKYHPERKKGSLNPNGVGKGDADSRCQSLAHRRQRMAELFGEKCMVCYNNSKEKMSDGTYWCETCKRRFNAL